MCERQDSSARAITRPSLDGEPNRRTSRAPRRARATPATAHHPSGEDQNHQPLAQYSTTRNTIQTRFAPIPTSTTTDLNLNNSTPPNLTPPAEHPGTIADTDQIPIPYQCHPNRFANRHHPPRGMYDHHASEPTTPPTPSPPTRTHLTTETSSPPHARQNADPPRPKQIANDTMPSPNHAPNTHTKPTTHRNPRPHNDTAKPPDAPVTQNLPLHPRPQHGTTQRAPPYSPTAPAPRYSNN